MTDGLLFYWTSWFLWGIVTFFFVKNSTRILLATSILICIICSHLYIVFIPYQMIVSFGVLIVVLTFKYVQLNKTLLHLLATFTIIIGYTGSRIWFISTPLSLFITEQILISLFMTFLICIMMYNLHTRLIVGLLGIAFGEVFYSLISISYYMDYTIGNLAFFDQLALIILFILFVDQMKRSRQWLTQKLLTNHYSLKPRYERLSKDC